ncbi:zinc finger protein 157-like [Eriocheir sinensis]|uniref:zinc finger protein 157-like n=1 Tax=Eriocheir sinensis TaxID=95602 RepID=UPI0021C62C7D|nr:zinc finger protein 157-like [Eriocheir sinensis]
MQLRRRPPLSVPASLGGHKPFPRPPQLPKAPPARPRHPRHPGISCSQLPSSPEARRAQKVLKRALSSAAATPASTALPTTQPPAALPRVWSSGATLERPQYSIQLPGGFWQDLLTPPPVWTTTAESSGAVEAPKQGSNMSSRDQQEKHLAADTSVQKVERKLECQVCGKTFRFKSDLTRHSVTHTGVRDFECTVCGKKFSQKPHLSKHVLTHTGVRDYECTVCAKKFSVKFALMRHSLTHTGVRNHECQECGKKFAQKYHLNQHILTHTY